MDKFRVHLHAVARAEMARARAVAARGLRPGDSILGDLSLWDQVIEDDDGFNLTQRRGDVIYQFKQDELEFVKAAEQAAKTPFFSLFIDLPVVSAATADKEDVQGLEERITDPPPPPPAAPGGRSIPTTCLTSKLLGQRPQPACVRAG